MTNKFTSALRRATKLVRAGNPVDATKTIQTALRGGGMAALDEMAKSSKKPFGRPRVGRSLRDTLASLNAGMARSATTAADVTEPPLTPGARFEAATFECPEGSRDYRLYIPDLKGRKPAAMIMMLHGCKQSPVDFAKGTGMNQLADAHGLIVVYPAQSRGANMQSCWNWYATSDQTRDAGEPAILAGLARQMQTDHGVARGRVFVAGLSAGAAMSVVLGQTHPDVFSGIGAHSGLPYKAAHDVPSAFAAMGTGSARNHETQPIPSIVFHGDADATVHVKNGQHIAEDAATGAQVVDDGSIKNRSFTRSTTLAPEGHAVMEHWTIAGLGHAWSGGDSAGSYTDPDGPVASAEMVRFFLNLPMKGA
jgi:poly(hydroxyalkanoate) depolymerase family esterase